MQMDPTGQVTLPSYNILPGGGSIRILSDKVISAKKIQAWIGPVETGPNPWIQALGFSEFLDFIDLLDFLDLCQNLRKLEFE